MKRFGTPDGRLGLIVILLSLVALVVWIPFDIETGLTEKLRRQVRIGDAMLPVVAVGFVILGGVMTLFVQQSDSPRLQGHNLVFLGTLLITLTVALTVMRWLGPLSVEILPSDTDYRVLRDTRPWKYLGFIAGGTILVAGLMAMMERRVTWRGVVVGLVTTLVLIIIYDLPFQDLLLPPNGDV